MAVKVVKLKKPQAVPTSTENAEPEQDTVAEMAAGVRMPGRVDRKAA